MRLFPVCSHSCSQSVPSLSTFFSFVFPVFPVYICAHMRRVLLLNIEFLVEHREHWEQTGWHVAHEGAYEAAYR